MKTLLLISFAAATFSGLCQGQVKSNFSAMNNSGSQKVLDSIVESNGNELISKKEFNYLENSEVKSVTNFHWSDSLYTWIPGQKWPCGFCGQYDRTIFDYNNYGDTLQQKWLCFGNSQWKDAKKIDYEYDEGNLVSKTTRYIGLGFWENFL